MTLLKLKYLEGLRTEVFTENGKFCFHTDASKEHGGKGEYISPTDVFAASLGSCILTIMGLQAKKLGIEFKDVSATVEKKASPMGGISEIIVHIHYHHSLDHETKEKLEKAAKHCPIHSSIDPKIKQAIHFHYK
jgi:putative redox protein